MEYVLENINRELNKYLYVDLHSNETLKEVMNVEGLEFINRRKSERKCTRPEYQPTLPCFKYESNVGVDAVDTNCPDYHHSGSASSPSSSATSSSSSSALYQLDEHQSTIRERILSQFSFDKRRCQVDIFTLCGMPGTGKTYLLHGFRNIKNIHTIYISNTNMLTLSANITYGVQSLTSFIMVTKMLRIDEIDYKSQRTFMDYLSYLPGDIFAGDNVPELINSPIVGDFTSTASLEHGNLFIFFDEVYSHHVGELSLILYLLRRFAKDYNLHVVILFVGDSDQITPFFNATRNYSFLFNAAIKKFNTTNQHFINDQEYMSFIEQLRNTTCRDECRHLIRQNFQQDMDNCKQDIKYNYPISKVLNKHIQFDSMQLINWFNKEDIANEILNIRLFTFTNADVHHNNLELARTIFSQLQNYEQKIDKNEEKSFFIESYIQFSKSENGDILPLIRYFPYRLLSRSMPVPYYSLVYLLDWSKSCCIVYEPNDKRRLRVEISEFYKRPYDEMFVGFPLQMAYSSTIHLSKGQLIRDHKIYINLSNADKNEIYVIMSRITGKNFVQGLAWLDTEDREEFKYIASPF